MSNNVPEAVPVMEAHVDEELLTREKYLREALDKQSRELDKDLEQKKLALAQKLCREENELNKQLEDRLVALDHEFEQKKLALRSRSARSWDLKTKQLREVTMELNATEEAQTRVVMEQRARREFADWAERNPELARQRDEEEHTTRKREIDAIHERFQEEINKLQARHADELFALQEIFLVRNRPMLIGSLLGGVVGLLLLPSSRGAL